ncbi:hypothetical protein [Moorena sp. SIO3I8]|nr:hypothetical protein [Moorena sp. SIO3I8]
MAELRKLFTTIHSGCMRSRLPNVNLIVNQWYNLTIRRAGNRSDN